MAYLCLVLALIDLDVDTFDWIDWPESPECSANKEDIAKSASIHRVEFLWMCKPKSKVILHRLPTLLVHGVLHDLSTRKILNKQDQTSIICLYSIPKYTASPI